MKIAGIIAGFLIFTVPALAIEAQQCPEKIGIESLFPPFQKHIRTFLKDSIRVFNTDTDGEPVGCSKALVVTFQDLREPGTKCFYVGCFASLSDVASANATVERSGLLLEMKTGDYGDNGPMRPTKSLKVRINPKAGTVKVE